MKIGPRTPNDVILEELGARLARVRKAQGLTQEALARSAGIGTATLRRIEDGRDSQLGSWLKLLKALRMESALDQLIPEDFRSPLADAREGRKRTRRSEADDAGAFRWGDERS